MKRLGLSLPLRGVALAEQGDWLRNAEDLGFSDFWTAEVDGLDAFTPLAAAAPVTRRARLGTAIAGVFQRGPALLAMEAAALAEAAPGRFALGIGASSPAVVEGWNDRTFRRPLARVRDTLRFLRRALAGERVDEAFETFAVRGFRLERRGFAPPPLFVAALRPRMLRLAGAEADGVLLGLLGAGDVPRVLAEARAARETDAPLESVLRLGVFATRDPERARRSIRRILAAYMTAGPYARFHAWLGRGADLAPVAEAWRAGDRKAAVAAVPDAWIEEFFAVGPPEHCRDRLVEFAEAGVTTPVVSLHPTEIDWGETLSVLAAALRS